MSGLIPKRFIDDLLARTDIVDIIDSYVPLKKSGSNHKAACPFHDEKTPSFTVSQDKQFYHCFGCGANGTAITFLMEYNRLDFVSAVEELAARAGLEVPKEGGDIQKRDTQLTELYELQELVVDFYRKQLKQHPTADRAVNYLKQRGLTGELAAKFELGYAPAGWENLINAMGKSDAAKKRLAKSGLIIFRDSGSYYDRFRDRIMFPIRDMRGRAIGFGGRVLDDGTPKYLNSPETPIFHKGSEIYGLYQARHASNKNIERIYVVEGYMDVLALAQHGISNAVATLGTAATREHLERVFKVTSEIVFCFDGDEAGRNAAWRAMETSLPLLRDGLQIYFMFMPQGKDPDDFVRENGRESFEDITNRVPLTDYLLNGLTQNFNPEIREQRSKLIHDAKSYLQKLPQGSLKQLMIEEVSNLANTDISVVEGQLESTQNRPLPPQRAPRVTQRSGRTLLAHTISLLLKRPAIALKIPENDDLSDIDLPGTDFLKELIRLIHETPDITLARILENWRGTKYENRLLELAPGSDSRYEKDEEFLQSDEYLQTEFLDALASLRDKSRKTEIRNLSNSKSPTELTEDEKEKFRNLNPAARLSK